MRRVHIDTYQLYEKQAEIYNDPAQFKILNCGRRYGKSTILNNATFLNVINGKKVGYYGYSYKTLDDAWNECVKVLSPIITDKDEGLRQLRTATGGLLHFWSSRDIRSGRGKNYDYVYGDEVCFWDKAEKIIMETILPTLADRNGKLMLASTPYGTGNYWYDLCTSPPKYFKVFKGTIYDNPFISADAIEILKDVTDPLIWQQEYEAEFVDMNAEKFFWNYDPDIHDADDTFELKDDVETWLSFDFNYDPCACTVYQIRGGGIFGMREYKVVGGTRELCKFMKTQDIMNVPKAYWTITGDQSGRAKTAVAGHVSNFDIIKEEFGLTNRQFVNTQGRNATHEYSRVMCNEFLYMIPFAIDDSMKHLKSDLKKAKPDLNGKLYKNRADGFEMDVVDTFRYFVAGKFLSGIDDMRSFVDAMKTYR